MRKVYVEISKKAKFSANLIVNEKDVFLIAVNNFLQYFVFLDITNKI